MTAPASDRILRGLLVLTVTVPALAFSWGREDGRISFVLYREPKLIAAAVLGWLLVAALAWRWRTELPAAEVAAVLERRGKPALLALAAFVSYLAATGLWVRVRENFFYELNQYVLLLALLAVLLVWTARDGRVPALVRTGLVASLALVTALGFLQAAVPLRVLDPIDPEIGVSHPSLMGYKNPAALALLGQVFLLAGLVFDRAARGRPRRIALALLLSVELAYLVSLRSRTAYAALLIACLYLLALRFARSPSWRRALRTLGAVAAVAVLFGIAVGVRESTRDKAASLLDYLTAPRTYLGSDRGTYLLNTLNMARYHPLGVGLGDWQTHYPVYRRYNRDVSFDDRRQVRRAHSDHVQFLGEAGWPGLALWLVFLGLVIGASARNYLKTGRRESLFTSAQLVAFAAAMATDYLLELPYNKLQFFLVVFLAVSPGDRGRHPPVPPSVERAPWRGTVAAMAVSVIAAAQIGYHGSLAQKIHAATGVERSYLRAVGGLAPAVGSPSRPRREDLLTALAHGRSFAGLVGHTKAFHRTWLLLGHTVHLLGRDAEARALTKRSLALHPYHPNALHMMSVVAKKPVNRRRWRRAYRHVLRQATRGFEIAYPAVELR